MSFVIVWLINSIHYQKKASSMKEKIGSDWAEDKLVEAGDDIKNTSPTKNEENCNGDLSKHETKVRHDSILNHLSHIYSDLFFYINERI